MAQEKRRGHLGRNLLLGFSAIVVVALLIIFLAPIVPAKVIEKQPYAANETYIESEPYLANETYYEAQPYSTTVPVSYTVAGTTIQSVVGQIASDCIVIINNTDTNSGTFTVTYYLVTMGGATATKYASQFIAGGMQQGVWLRHTGDYIPSFTYSITPPTKQVIQYQNVQKTREVTLYRDVEKVREVVKYRDVEKSKRVTVVDYITD
jgi:hypothetical protein